MFKHVLIPTDGSRLSKKAVKAGIAFAKELGARKIRVNSINPGSTRTRMRAQAYPAENPETLKPPEALAVPYLYLLGPAGRSVRGQRLEAGRSNVYPSETSPVG